MKRQLDRGTKDEIVEVSTNLDEEEKVFDKEVDPILSVLSRFVISPNTINEETYERANTLLAIYKDVNWNLTTKVEELNDECEEILKEDIAFAIEILDKFDYRVDMGKLEGRLTNLQEVQILQRFIVLAALKVKSYPDDGEKYFNILSLRYINKYKYSENEVLYRLDISKSTFYRQKKKAIKLFGYCLWNIILSQMKQETKTKQIKVVGICN